MASIKQCKLMEVKASPEHNHYEVIVQMGADVNNLIVLDYYDCGTTNVIAFAQAELKRLSRFNKLTTTHYDALPIYSWKTERYKNQHLNFTKNKQH